MPHAGYTPLMYACLADAPEVVKLLLTKVRTGRRTTGLPSYSSVPYLHPYMSLL